MRQEAIEGQLYLKAMDAGEVFFIAVGQVDGRSAVIGFASDYCIEGRARSMAPPCTFAADQRAKVLVRLSSREPKPTRSRAAQRASISRRRSRA
jgi:hypothetical protein